MKYLSDYTQKEIEEAFRERNQKDAVLPIRISKKAKEIIESAASEEDLDVSVFIRKAVEKEVIRLSK